MYEVFHSVDMEQKMFFILLKLAWSVIVYLYLEHAHHYFFVRHLYDQKRLIILHLYAVIEPINLELTLNCGDTLNDTANLRTCSEKY